MGSYVDQTIYGRHIPVFKSYAETDFKSYTVHIWSYAGDIWSLSLTIYGIICQQGFQIICQIIYGLKTVYDLNVKSYMDWSINIWIGIWIVFVVEKFQFPSNHIWCPYMIVICMSNHIWCPYMIIICMSNHNVKSYMVSIYGLHMYTYQIIYGVHIWLLHNGLYMYSTYITLTYGPIYGLSMSYKWSYMNPAYDQSYMKSYMKPYMKSYECRTYQIIVY